MLETTKKVIKMLTKNGIFVTKVELVNGLIIPVDQLDPKIHNDGDIDNFLYYTIDNFLYYTKEQLKKNNNVIEGIELDTIEGTWSFYDEA